MNKLHKENKGETYYFLRCLVQIQNTFIQQKLF